MRNKKGNNLIIIENGQLTSYVLDDKKIWEIGRPSKENMPDIRLHSATVSRKHGKFQNVDGVWFYLDYNGKNGTVYNKKHITPGLKGNRKPIILNDGDTFVFGGGEEESLIAKRYGQCLQKRFMMKNGILLTQKDIQDCNSHQVKIQ